jgi:16S rRNA (guanine966-N2)-methyltransferase
MRIIAGSARGRRLWAPKGSATRPTGDKVRAAIFNLLGQFFSGGKALDLYSGTGAMALEALSRGFASAVCVEDDRAAARAILRNASACGFAERVQLLQEPVERALGRLPASAFAVAFVDPPYEKGSDMALGLLAPFMVDGGRVVAEHHRDRPPADRYGPLALTHRRTYGDTGVSIYETSLPESR